LEYARSTNIEAADAGATNTNIDLTIDGTVEAQMAKPIIVGKFRSLNFDRGSLLIMVTGALSFFSPFPVFADDWGCQVLLCLADPRGPETESECKPPIEKLWNALEHGKPFPTCDLNISAADLPPDVINSLPASALNVGQGTGAQSVGAGPNYCSPDLLFWGPPEQSMLTCGARGAINVTIDNTLFTRVWWGIKGKTTITEFYGQGSSTVPYDPASSAQQFLSKTDAPGSGNASGVDSGGNH
jgi:hypothetical protein